MAGTTGGPVFQPRPLALSVAYAQVPAPQVSAPQVPAAARPVLLMGATYSRYKREALRRDVLEPNELTFEDGGDFVSAEIWKNYSVVIVTHGFPALNERELGWIRDYLNEGGRLILAGPVLPSLNSLKGEQRDWIGAAAHRTVRTGEFAVSAPGVPFLKDAEGAAKVFGRTASYALDKLTTAVPLATRDGSAVFARNNYGKGEVWFVGTEYFPLLASEPDSKARVQVGAPAKALWTQLVANGKIQKKSDRIGAGLKAMNATTPVVWRRDFAEARGASYQDPPFPRPGEELRGIELDLAQGEWETVPFYISNAAARPQFSVTLPDLLPAGGEPGGQKFSAAKMRLRVQGVAEPALTVGPFWLLDTPRNGQAVSVPLKANDSSSLWLTLDTRGMAPGQYQGLIRFSEPALKPLPLTVRIWPVQLPGHQYFETQATFVWTSLMPSSGGKSYNFPSPPGDLTPFRNHIENLAAHHVTYNADVSWSGRYGKSVSLRNVRLQGSGVPFEDALARGLIQLDALPPLDFSYFDPFVEIPLQAGIPYFLFNFKNNPGDWLVYARTITGDPKLAEDSPAHVAVKKWLYGECLRYLRSKGIQKIVSFVADEIGPEEIPDVTRRAALMRSLGAQVAFTATGMVGQQRDHIAALNQSIDRWTWNTAILPAAKQMLATDSPIDAADAQYNYVADWHRAPYVFNRTRGAFCAYHELDGLMIHGYLRWYPNGGAVYNTPEGPVDTEGWEGARDGIEDARLWKRAQVLLKAASAQPNPQPEVAAKLAALRQKMAAWVSPSDKSNVELRPAAYSIYKYQDPVSSYLRLLALKRELLEALVWLDGHVPVVRSVTYAGLPLIERGAPAAAISGNTAAAAQLNRGLAARGLAQLPVVAPDALPASASGSPTAIRLITRAESSTLMAPGGPGGGAQSNSLANALASVDPAPGSYRFVLHERQLILVGGDAAGLTKAVDVLLTVMETTEIPALQASGVAAKVAYGASGTSAKDKL